MKSMPVVSFARSAPHAWQSVKHFAVAHKLLAAIGLIVVFGGAYWIYGAMANSSGQTRYVLGTVTQGTVISSVSGSGQVSPSDQVDVKPKASGDVISVPVQEGQFVKAGTALAYLDSTDAQKAVRDAEANLQSSQISFNKLKEPADQLSLTQAQNAALNASTTLETEYDAAFNNVSSTFLDEPSIMTGVYSVLYSYDRTLGGSSLANAEFYQNTINTYDATLKGTSYHDDALAKYQSAKKLYDASFTEYKTTDRTASHDAVEKLLNGTYATTQAISDALKSASALIQLYQDTMTAQGLTPNATSNTHLSTLGGYTSTANGHVSSLSSTISSLSSDKQDVVQTSQSLQKLVSGADPLDVQSSQLSVQQRQNALQDAQDTLADYTVRAPFDGTVAKLDVKKGDSASSGTAVATLITQQQIAEISVNEIDAAKMKVGQKATLTFDAIDGLSITGQVASVDTLGTVSQGVVSYDVKIGFDTQDTRVKPGMTVNSSIQTDVHQNVLTVPSGAVKTQGGQTYVQVFNPPLANAGGTSGVTSDTAPQNVSVTTGISDDTNTEIDSGLTAGEQIVTATRTGSTAATATTRTTTTGAATGGGNRGFGGGGGLGGIRLGG